MQLLIDIIVAFFLLLIMFFLALLNIINVFYIYLINKI